MKEEKLTLRHLSGYLPYGLKVRYFDAERGEEKICRIELLHIPDEVTITDGMDEYDVELSDIKPLLIPLSELTEDQWVEVFKAGDDNRHENLMCEIRPIGDVIIKWCGTLAAMTYDFESVSFQCHFKFNQPAAFNKLYELHADLENLIELGLALNKNTK